MSAPLWLVTGASSGVGRTLAWFLAASGAQVILTARRVAALEGTAQKCPGAWIIPADLSDPASVARLSEAVRDSLAGRPLAGIVHAAGVMVWTSPVTVSGWSLVPAVNALAPWRLTRLLEPELLQQTGARVLFVAGAPFTLPQGRPQLSGWIGEQRGRGPTLALEAARAKVFMAEVLHRRWAGRASAFAFHPGFVRSQLAEGLPFPINLLGRLVQPFLSARCRSGEFLISSPDAPPLSGTLVAGRRSAPSVPDPDAEAWVASLPL